jgi:hypothetical protein
MAPPHGFHELVEVLEGRVEQLLRLVGIDSGNVAS